MRSSPSSPFAAVLVVPSPFGPSSSPSVPFASPPPLPCRRRRAVSGAAIVASRSFCLRPFAVRRLPSLRRRSSFRRLCHCASSPPLLAVAVGCDVAVISCVDVHVCIYICLYTRTSMYICHVLVHLPPTPTRHLGVFWGRLRVNPC